MNVEVVPSGLRGEKAGPAQWLGGANEPHAYRILRKLGTGGMAEVYLAARTGEAGFARQVAIKLVREDFAKVGELRELFATEARLASRLTHPNIVAVLDYDCDGQGRPFLVMEYMGGVDLFVALGHPRPLPVAVAVFIAAEILRGLAYAHDLPSNVELRGVVHRDLSPQNVLLSWEGAVKVADFGIAKALMRSSVSGAFVGKPAYMSPEQVRGDRLDGRSDLYSAGVVLWEMLAGRRLFGQGRVKEIFAEIELGEVPRPSSVRAEVPEELDLVMSRLLAVNRAERYARAEEALADLMKCQCMPLDGAGELMAALAERFHRPPRGSDGISVIADDPEVFDAGDRTPTIRTETDKPSSHSRAMSSPTASGARADGEPQWAPPLAVIAANASERVGEVSPTTTAAPSPTARRRIVVAVGAVIAIAVLLALFAGGGAETGSSSASPTPAPSIPAPGTPPEGRAQPVASPAARAEAPVLAAPAPRSLLSPPPAERRDAKQRRPSVRRGPSAPPASTSGIIDLRLDTRVP